MIHLSMGRIKPGEANVSYLVLLGEQTDGNHAPCSTKPVDTGGANSVVNPPILQERRGDVSHEAAHCPNHHRAVDIEHCAAPRHPD